jgi:hypothetical protein
MSQAGLNPTLNELPVPLSKVVARILQIHMQAAARSSMMTRGVIGRHIHIIGWRRLEGPQRSAPDQDEFFLPIDPETGGRVFISPFPWLDGCIVREVRSPRRPSLIMRRCIVHEPTVLWGEVRAWCRANAVEDLSETVEDVPSPSDAQLLAQRLAELTKAISQKATTTAESAQEEPESAQVGTSNDQEQPSVFGVRRLTGKDRVISIAKNMKAAGEITAGISKTGFAKELALRSGHDNPNYYRTIRTHAASWGIWPIDRI